MQPPSMMPAFTLAVMGFVMPMAMVAALAQDVTADRAELLSAKTLHCTFDKGSLGAWSSDGRLAVKPLDWGKDAVIFDSIDTVSGRGRMIGNMGASDITVSATARGVHLIETTPAGNVILTTVFPRRSAEGFVAVMSRHLDMLDIPVPSQYHGTCRSLR